MRNPWTRGHWCTQTRYLYKAYRRPRAQGNRQGSKGVPPIQAKTRGFTRINLTEPRSQILKWCLKVRIGGPNGLGGLVRRPRLPMSTGTRRSPVGRSEKIGRAHNVMASRGRPLPPDWRLPAAGFNCQAPYLHPMMSQPSNGVTEFKLCDRSINYVADI